MWFNAYGLKDMGYVENEATRVCEYACQIVPGLLQTDAYMRAAFAGPTVAIRDSKNPSAILSFPVSSFSALTH